MLKIWDAHNFRRTLTGLSLIAAPPVLSVLFLPAFVGLIHLLRDRGVVLGHLGGARYLAVVPAVHRWHAY